MRLSGIRDVLRACGKVLAILGVTVFASVCDASNTPRYTVTDLGALEHASESLPFAMNNGGAVVGYYNTTGAHAFLYSGGQMTELKAFEGTGPYSSATGINDSGQIAGTLDGHAILYSTGTTSELGALPGLPYTSASSINNNSQIVGTASLSISDESQGHAFLYDKGTMSDLGVLAGFSNSIANDINNFGHVVGTSTNSSSVTHAFLYRDGQMNDLGTLGGTFSGAAGINDHDQVIGDSLVSGTDWGTDHAFLYSGGVMHDLGSLPGTAISSARGINNAGDVVGSTAGAVGQPSYHAFLYSGGQMTDLNSLIAPTGWTLVDATAINDVGQIVGYGYKVGQTRDAFLLTPIVPEPTTGGLLALAILMLRRVRTRR